MADTGSNGAGAGRSAQNSSFADTSFLYGGNASYVAQLQDAYEQDPASVDPEWREFFDALNDDKSTVEKNARGAPWKSKTWPIAAKGDLVNALDGDWPTAEKALGDKIKAKAEAKGAPISDADVLRATRDSVRAIMMIRAYRMRGHLHANLDPLGLEARGDHEELHPSSYGFEDADYDRKIFIDHVLGLEYATIFEMLAILRRTYCSTIGYEFMHISDPTEKSWIQERIEGQHKEIAFTKEGKRAILQKLVEAEGFEKFIDVKYTGTKRFGLDGGESIIPALEQIIKRGGALGAQGDRVRHGPPRPSQHSLPGDGQAAPRAVPRVQGRIVPARRGRRFRRREVPSRRIVRPRVRQQQGASVADRQSLASRDRRSRRARQGARQAGSASRRRRSEPSVGHAVADPRRCRFRRPGRGRRMSRPVRPQGPSHRRLDPFHHQQSDRLHHLPTLFALLALSVRCGEDGGGANLPCERRRSRSGRVRGQGRNRISPALRQAGRGRHVVLSPLRPQ